MKQLRCQPGDLAFIRNGKHSGKFVDVIYLAPGEEFYLPNGVRNEAGDGSQWVVKLIGWSITARTDTGGKYTTQWGCAPDHNLTPVRGNLDAATHRAERAEV
tara:strand:- start:3631 stop:3936 length:306 start_codon:yes stop_codon:yes gene_type:complete